MSSTGSFSRFFGLKGAFSALFILAALILPAKAGTITLSVDYTINYYPPNPCEETYLGDYTLADTEMSGSLTIYYLDYRVDRLDPIPLATVAWPPNPCAGSVSDTLRFEADLLDTSNIYVSLTGDITFPPNPIRPAYPVYAFPEGTRAVAEDPGSKAPISLGTVDYLSENPEPAGLPLFAFASPGVQVGGLVVDVNPLLVIGVTIDIKPGSDPNSINLGSAGVVPVAILSEAGFNAPEEIDPETISLAGASVKMVGKSSKYLCHSEDVNSDGLLDLMCQVETVGFIIEPGDSTAVLEAATYGGTPVRGEDAIQIVP